MPLVYDIPDLEVFHIVPVLHLSACANHDVVPYIEGDDTTEHCYRTTGRYCVITDVFPVATTANATIVTLHHNIRIH